MATVSDVITWFEQFAPQSLAEDWDNVGLLLGDPRSTVDSALTCLTLTEDVADEAIRQGVQLIVSHHPILFRAVKRLTASNAEGRIVMKLLEAGVAVFSPHTRYDSALDGINAQLGLGLNLQNLQPLRPLDEACSQSPAIGSGRYGDLSAAMSLSDFARLAAKNTSADLVQFTGQADKPVQRIGIACGAAAEFMHDAAKLGCDALLTGEARFHSCLESRAKGISLVLLGHYASERPAMIHLAKLLAADLSIACSASQDESDPLTSISLA